jgi:hypothetical protein
LKSLSLNVSLHGSKDNSRIGSPKSSMPSSAFLENKEDDEVIECDESNSNQIQSEITI